MQLSFQDFEDVCLTLPRDILLLGKYHALFFIRNRLSFKGPIFVF